MREFLLGLFISSVGWIPALVAAFAMSMNYPNSEVFEYSLVGFFAACVIILISLIVAMETQ